MRKEGADTAVMAAIAALDDLDSWSLADVEAALRGMLESTGLSARKGLQPLRVAVTGSSVSPPLFESIEVLGRDRTMERLRSAAGRISAGE